MKPDDVNNLIGVFMVLVWALKFLYHFEYLRRIQKHLEAQNFISFFRIDNMGYYFLTVAPVFGRCRMTVRANHKKSV